MSGPSRHHRGIRHHRCPRRIGTWGESGRSPPAGRERELSYDGRRGPGHWTCAEGGRMRILVAEDSTLQADYLRRMLEAMGHEVFHAADGDAAWQILREEPIPLVLSDWVMPGLDGLELCRRIRARPGGSYTYVILLTVR